MTKAATVNYKPKKLRLAFSTTALFLMVSFAFLCSIFTSSAVLAREMIEHPRVKLQSLDKVTARTMTFEADVGSTLRFGPLYIRVQKCKKSSPIEKPESAAFLQVWEVDPGAEPEWVFSGWMFSSSPALSAMDHPIYDVWVLDCLPDKNALISPKPTEEKNEETDGKKEHKAPASAQQETKEQIDNSTAASSQDTLE